MLASVKRFGINSTTLKILAMATMLCDHMWVIIFPENLWLTCVGRIAFPIFAFQIVEGFYYTHNRSTYMKRMFLFALVSEIPFDLMVSGRMFYPYHQNVMFTFLIALWVLSQIDKIDHKNYGFNAQTVLPILVWALLGNAIGSLTLVDYGGAGVLTVLLFYFTRGQQHTWIWQLSGMYIINCMILGDFTVSAHFLNTTFVFPLQAFALLALIPIWMYNGKKGWSNKLWQYSVYLFYPLHLLMLWALSLLL